MTDHRADLAQRLEQDAGYIDDNLSDGSGRVLICSAEGAKRIASNLVEAAAELRPPAVAEVEEIALWHERQAAACETSVIKKKMYSYTAALLRRLSPTEEGWRPIDIVKTLRDFASGDKRTPRALHQVPFVAMDAIADWLDAFPAPPSLPETEEKR